MAPKPEEHTITTKPDIQETTKMDSERVVISGMSGLYPDSHHIKDLSNILYNKINPVTTDNSRWNFNHPEVSHYTGKVPDLDLFDAQFFRVHYRLGNNMDSMSRKILEQAYQAIYDAGVSPEHLYGKKVGVFIGSCFSETEKVCFYVASSRNGFGIAGCSKTMFANRISYWLNAKGPSLSIDAACCSSTTALEQAYLAVSRGDCEAAIVGGANLCLHPQSSIHYGRIMTLSKDGKTKSFTENADGCAKSEAINVLFLQKAKDALRIYADIVHVKTEFTSISQGEAGPRYGFYRDSDITANFMRNFYKDANVSPKEVEYVEAFGSGVPEGDKSELKAIEKVFCDDREDPLYIGSVMSNIGYGEAASGISAVTKVLLGYHTGQLAANLHCEKPRQDIDALCDGRMKVVTEHQDFSRKLVAINGMSVTGINSHVLLNGHYKPKDLNRYKTNIPHLVTISGRQESAVRIILDDLKSKHVDPEELALLHNIHETRISGHLGRGFTVLDVDEEGKTISLHEEADYFDDAKGPLWFVYSGMGSQWAGMGAHLMRIPIFAAAIEGCRRVLEPKGVDIVDIITSPNKNMFDNILNSFVGIAAIQIGLTDILKELGLVPDKIIGHSVGELGCAYADGCFTAEEMILSAYSRGLVSIQTPFIKGSMAAVGIGYEEISKKCPPEIEVACHNGPDSSTISGPSDIMKEFVAKLTEEGIFAREVPCSNIAYHSRYIAKAGPGLLKYLSDVIKTPKLRSERWVSTSVPQTKWDEPSARYSSAEYHTNNLLSPVLFEETSALIPSNAVLVEIAPHGLLQAILKRSLPSGCLNVPLTLRGHKDNAQYLLEAVGKLYMKGYNLKVKALYPTVEFPVSTGTPLLSHLTEWAHNEKWELPLYVSARKKTAAACTFCISIHDDEHAYLMGRVVRGKIVYPFAAALISVWDTLAMSLEVPRKELSVMFNDLHFYSEPVMLDQRQLRLSVAFHRGTGKFEVLNDGSKVVTGFLTTLDDSIETQTLNIEKQGELNVDSENVYRLFNEKDYEFTGEFKSINRTNFTLTDAEIKWTGNWATFLDGLIQFQLLKRHHQSISKPTQIRNMIIDVKKHNDCLGKKSNILLANICEIQDSIRCGGVVMQNVRFYDMPPINMESKVSLKALNFVPYFESLNINEPLALQVYAQIVAENISKSSINVVEISNDMIPISYVRTALKDVAGVRVQYKSIQDSKTNENTENLLLNADLLIVYNLLNNDELFQLLSRVLQRKTFITNIQVDETIKSIVRPPILYNVVSSYNINGMRLELACWRPTSGLSDSTVVNIRSQSELTLLSSTRNDLPPKHKLLVISSYPPITGLVELIKQWRKETTRNQIYLVMTNHYLDQLPDLNLAFNVLNDQGVWGGEYYIPYPENKGAEHAVALQCTTIGDMQSFQWVESNKMISPAVSVEVHFASISDYDVKMALGIIPFNGTEGQEPQYGMEFSGITESGERVMGLIKNGALCSQIQANPEFLWPVPSHWSLEDAATVPLAYTIAFYCLEIKSSISRGETVLIHGGAGAIGQAAISIALAKGCQVFTTVSDVKKKQFLRKMFPDLKEDHIGNSRDITFGDMIMMATKGVGCHIAVSCVEGELKNTTLSCIANYGRMCDTSQLITQEKFAFGMFHLTKERHYLSIDFSSLFTNNSDANRADMKNLNLMVLEGIAKGYVRPLSRITYAPSDACKGFKLIAESRHRGRILLRLKDTQKTAEQRIVCLPNKIQLVMCNEESLSIQLVEKLISRGARNFFLHCTRKFSYLPFKLKLWKSYGVNVQISSQDLRDKKDVTSLLEECNRMEPIEGIYYILPSVLDKESEHFSAEIDNIDLVSRSLCSSVKYFAVLVVSDNLIGRKTIINRRQNKLPGTLINLSALEKTRKGVFWKTVIDATEQALRSDHPILMSHQKGPIHKNLLQQISAIAGINMSEKVHESYTLTELNIEKSKLKAIGIFLSDVHNISLPDYEIPTLSVERIKNIESIITDIKFNEEKGLKTFYSYVDPDELLGTTDMIFLPSQGYFISMAEYEFDASKAYICMIPGLEGHFGRFLTLCERLKLQTFVLQPGQDHENESIQELAERYAKILLKKTQLSNTFHLLGYETGVMVALEIAAILEQQGLTGTVYCVGGTPEDVQCTISKEVSQYESEDSLKNSVACHMYELMTKENSEQLSCTLKDISSWNEKVEVTVRALLGRVPHSAQYAAALIKTAFARIGQALQYELKLKPLRSKIILLRSSAFESPITLQNFSCQKIEVQKLRAPLSHATYDHRCASIVNRFIHSELLEEFKNKNICESYLIDGEAFQLHST